MSEIGTPTELPSLEGRDRPWALYAMIALCDIELAVHSLRSTLLAFSLATEVRVVVDEPHTWAFLLHDIGLLQVPAELLRTPGPLSDGQREVVGEHTIAGARMVAMLPDIADAAEIVLRHHERWDGTGYPSGLTGPEIPAAARVLAVADVYAALTAPRPHRDAYPASEAMEIVGAMSGTQFDPVIVEALSGLAAQPGMLTSAGASDRGAALGNRLWTHIQRGSSLSAAQREALFAAAIGLEASDAAARLGRATGTQRTWASSLRRSLAVAPRVPLPVFLSGIGREVFMTLAPPPHRPR